MKSYSQALKILKKNKLTIENEKIKSSQSLNRVSAINIYSNTYHPAANNSAFDGYVVNSRDTKNLNSKKPSLFKILGLIPAGKKPKIQRIKKFQTYEIMTGGLLPKGFDAIIPKEQVIYYPNKKRAKYSFEILDSIKGKNIYRVFPHKIFCDSLIKHRCVSHNDKKIFYSDDDHLSSKGAEMINSLIMDEIKKIEQISN